MTDYKSLIVISKSDARDINRYLTATSPDDFMGEDATITFTAKFENGFEMDVKCCGSKDEHAWTEAVLFDQRGCQLAYTEPDEEFLGTWELEYEDMRFRVEVSVSSDDQEDDKPASKRKGELDIFFSDLKPDAQKRVLDFYGLDPAKGDPFALDKMPLDTLYYEGGQND